MRQSHLPPPRPIRARTPVSLNAPGLASPEHIFARPAGGLSPGAGDGLEEESLGQPRPARPRLRHLFNPVSGWFRRLERRASHLLSKHLFPHLPGATWPYAYQLRRHLTVSRAEIPMPGLPPAFDGTGILLITDVHTGPFLSPAALDGVFGRLQTLRPDLVLFGGDLTTGRVDELAPFAEVFRKLRAPLGVFGVLGNHDHYSDDPAGVRARLEEGGVTVLHNRGIFLERNGQRLGLAGIDDLYCGQPDLDAALRSVVSEPAHLKGESASVDGRGDEPVPVAVPEGEPLILLSHNPDVFFVAAQRRIPLVLSGHTHGGQVRIPGLPVLVRMSRYHLDEGRYEGDGSQLVVSRGLGVTGIPLRFFCSPEAVFLRLRRA